MECHGGEGAVVGGCCTELTKMEKILRFIIIVFLLVTLFFSLKSPFLAGFERV